MKFLKTALVLFLVPLLTSSVDHKFYVSITSIEHAPKEESLQIITKIFLDDIEDALEKRYNRKFKFNSQNEKEGDELILKDYVFHKLKVKANETPATLNYIGREYDIDVVKIYIEIPNVPTLKTIEIENQVLFDMFTDQQNIVHIRNGDTRRSLILENQNPKGLLNFNQ